MLSALASPNTVPITSHNCTFGGLESRFLLRQKHGETVEWSFFNGVKTCSFSSLAPYPDIKNQIYGECGSETITGMLRPNSGSLTLISVYGYEWDDFYEFSFRYSCTTDTESVTVCRAVPDRTISFLLDYRNSQWATTAKFKFRPAGAHWDALPMEYCAFQFFDFQPDESIDFESGLCNGTDQVSGRLDGGIFEDAKQGVSRSSQPLFHIRYSPDSKEVLSNSTFRVECQIVVPVEKKPPEILNLMNAQLQLSLIFFLLIVSPLAATVVTPFLLRDGYTADTWDQYPPGGCTGQYSVLNRVFPFGDIKQWTGEDKLKAVRMVAEKYNFMVIASPEAPRRCFEFVDVVNTDTGDSVRAVVVDFDEPMTSDNMADVSQAVIDRLWGDSYIEGQRLPARIEYTGQVVQEMRAPQFPESTDRATSSAQQLATTAITCLLLLVL
ncbi:MAG: hypothetical protein SGCHY_002702 [Lobulomycetales sp.]